MGAENLNIAMVVRCFSPNGGLELYAHKVIEGLLTRGHTVTVFCQQNTSDLKHPNLRVRQVELRSDKLRKSKRLKHDLNAGDQALAGEYQQFDIVHSQHYPTSYASVVTFHNHTVMRWSKVGLPWERSVNDIKFNLVEAYKLRDEHDRLLCKNAQCLVFPAQVMQADYYAQYPFLAQERKPYVVAYPGASLGGDEAVSNVERPHNPFTFLFVGRGYRRKGLDKVFEACRILSAKGREFQLVIAGLSCKPIDRARLLLHGLSNKVKYLGFRKDMHNVYALADAAVLPSRVEPFGMAPLQAAGNGLVPIVSRVSGCSEVLQHDEDCLVLDNHLDATELAEHMGRLIEDASLLHKLADKARKTAQQVNWEATVESTIAAYELVLEARRKQLAQPVN